MKIMRHILFILIFGSIFFTYNPQKAVAAEETSALSFQYETLLPENQISDKSYFDLKMEPGAKQTVQIRLINPTNQGLQIAVSLNGTKTSPNGEINWGPNTITSDPSLPYEFTELVSSQNVVEVAAQSSEFLTLAIEMPTESFDGVIAGGIQLSEIKEDSTAGEGMIVNKYAYVIGMLLQETDVEIAPDLKLNDVTAGVSEFKNAVFVNFSNTQPTFVGDMTTKVAIRKADSEEVLYRTEKSQMTMAPNSQIDFPISLADQRFIGGEYVATIEVSIGEALWQWEEPFTITDQAALEFNQQTVTAGQGANDGSLLPVIVFFASLLALIILALLFKEVHRKRQKRRKRKA
ncbi:DUF916 and DUF3324 domain-containing protein [Enterococcus sp. LJL120]